MRLGSGVNMLERSMIIDAIRLLKLADEPSGTVAVRRQARTRRSQIDASSNDSL